MAEPDLVSIECGTDRFAADTLVARCRAEGLQVELITRDASGNELTPIRAPLVLLVHADDVDTVRAIATGEPTPAKQAKLDRARRRRTGR
jgi:hypothetical protein